MVLFEIRSKPGWDGMATAKGLLGGGLSLLHSDMTSLSHGYTIRRQRLGFLRPTRCNASLATRISQDAARIRPFAATARVIYLF